MSFLIQFMLVTIDYVIFITNQCYTTIRISSNEGQHKLVSTYKEARKTFYNELTYLY